MFLVSKDELHPIPKDLRLLARFIEKELLEDD